MQRARFIFLVAIPFFFLQAAGLAVQFPPPGWTHYTPAGSPYREHTVQIHHGTLTLPGHLVLPARPGRYPALVLMGGSGSWGPYLKYFRALIDQFVPGGMAVLYYEKRAEGTERAEKSSFTDLAGDALAAVHFLQKRPEIDAHRVGLWGHSQGGWIAPLAASQSADVAFLITVSGPGVGPFEQMMYFGANRDRSRGLSEKDVSKADALRRRLALYYAHPTEKGWQQAQQALEAARRQPWFGRARFQELQGVKDRLASPERIAEINQKYPWVLQFYREQVPYDPIPALRAVHVPLLALFGGADRSVPVERSVEAFRRAFSQSGNPNLTVKVFPGANHAILMGPFSSLEFAPGYLKTMSDWLVRLSSTADANPVAGKEASAPGPD